MTSVDFRFGLIGRDIGYSKSPDIFQAIFRATGHSGLFELIDLEPDALELKFYAMRTGYNGLSVTIPHKQLVCSLVDQVTDSAAAVGAVNSIYIRHGKTIGGNTDIDGFLLPLKSLTEQLKNKRAVVIGSGGSARAVVYALLHTLNMKECFVLGRDERHLHALVDQLTPYLPGHSVKTTTGFAEIADSTLIVNCTPLGGFHLPNDAPIPDDLSFPSDCFYYDLNYNRPNKVITTMKGRGCRVIDGSLMLVGQAVASFKWWTGIEVDAAAIARDIFPDATP